MACDSVRAVGPGVLVSSWRRLGWLEGKVKFSGFRRREPLWIRYVPFSMAMEGEFWVARWVRKLDIGEAMHVVADGVGCGTFRVVAGSNVGCVHAIEIYFSDCLAWNLSSR